LKLFMNMAKRNTASTFARLLGILALTLIAMATNVWGQLPVPASSQFDITGYIQSATLGGPGTGSGVGAHQGGFMTVNGHVVTIPSETIVVLPANVLTWQEIFAQSPAPYTGVATGMALADVPAPLASYEARIVGNRVNGTYIAGLIWVSQQALNQGQGFINFINYATGEIRVGGVIGDNTTGTRVQLNDPLVAAVGTGRYGRAMTIDARFMVDQDNPTVRSGTGYPMCIPRVLADPSIPGNPDDALCPLSQRPAVAAPQTGFASFIQSNNPLTLPGVPPDATKQTPFEVGDWVTFAGTLVQDLAPLTPTAGPWPGIANTYVSAHTLVNNVAIYTWPGTSPAYTAIDVAFVGTGGLTVIGANEAAIMTRFEGFSTDTSRVVHLYANDLNPLNGAVSDRTYGTIGVDPGAPKGAATGRWRFRPPCVLTAPDPLNFKDCQGPPSNSFLPPTREVRAVVEGAWVPGQTTTYANGIIAGQYHAPLGDYRFPENLPGKPVVENNFNSMDFLAHGGYTSSAGTLVGQLNPWPSATPPPPPLCTTAPVTSSGGPYSSLASGGTITLNGSAATPDVPVTFLWTATAGTFSNATLANPVFTAPLVASQTNITLTLTVTTCGGTNASTTTIMVNAALAPTVTYTPRVPVTVFSGTPISLTASCTDPNVPPATPCTFMWTQTNAGALGVPTVLIPNPNPNPTISFTVTLPPGQATGIPIQLQAVATNSLGIVSGPDFTTVTFMPLPDLITATSAIYRVNNRRLIITATSSDISANLVLTLQPFVTIAGTTYNPDPVAGGVGNVFTNLGGGLYSITLNGLPEPACGNAGGNFTPCPTKPLQVNSNLGGVSPFFALTKIQ
jgi:hypothetical protein